MAGANGTPPSLTLDKGLQILEVLAEARTPMTTAMLAEAVGMHRSIAYRLIRTLEVHGLVRRRSDGAYEPGLALAALARSVSSPLQAAVLPQLVAVADELGMTAFLVVADGDDCLTLLSVEPRQTAAHVAYRPGNRHPLERGAPGIALLAGRPAGNDERPEVEAARRRGYAMTQGEVAPGITSVAVPVVVADEPAAIAVVYVLGDEAGGFGGTPTIEEVAARLQRATTELQDGTGTGTGARNGPNLIRT